jgi:hypothetical protein
VSSDPERVRRESQLPPELAELVARVQTRTRLWKSERRAVGVELTAHFLDGLDAGCTTRELIDAFGDPEHAARLIRAAKRKCRSPAWKLYVVLSRSIVVVMLWFVTIYGVSAHRLYASDEQLARTSVLWGRGADAVAALRLEVVARLADARLGARLQQPDRAVVDLRAAFTIAKRLQDASAPSYEFAAMEVYDQAAALAAELVRADAASGVGVRDALRRLTRQIEVDRVHVRASVIRSGFADLIASVYTRDEVGGGRLTGHGLRLIQALNGKTRPGIRALLFEPALFALPVGRSEAEREITRLLDIAGGGAESAEYLSDASALRRAVARRARSRRELFAYYPALVFMPQLSNAIERAERARASLALARR